MNKASLISILLLALLSNPASALVVASEQVECLGWYHDRAINDFAVETLKPSEIDPLMFEGEISEVQFGADLAYLGQEGVGLFVTDLITGARFFSISGWYRLGSSMIYEANLTVQAPDPQRKSVQFGVRCLAEP